jgi:hypothetical protein
MPQAECKRPSPTFELEDINAPRVENPGASAIFRPRDVSLLRERHADVVSGWFKERVDACDVYQSGTDGIRHTDSAASG